MKLGFLNKRLKREVCHNKEMGYIRRYISPHLEAGINFKGHNMSSLETKGLRNPKPSSKGRYPIL